MAGPLMMAYRMLGMTILLILFALVIVVVKDQWKGNDRLRCPKMDPAEYPWYGRGVGEGGGCGYADGAPKCKNEDLKLPLDEGEHELACSNYKCMQKLEVGQPCGDRLPNGNYSANPSACSTGSCRFDAESDLFKCAERHTGSIGSACASEMDCRHSLFCARNNTCLPRATLGFPCSIEDNLSSTLPGSHTSKECADGSYCTRTSGTHISAMTCLSKSFGAIGTPCVWNPSTDSRPHCLRGKAYCSEDGVCLDLVAAEGRCSYNTLGGFRDNLAPCVYGYGCHPDAPLNTSSGRVWVPGTCKKTHGLAAGDIAFVAEFCEYGTYLDTATHHCAVPRKTGTACAATTDCVTSSADAGQLACTCSKANNFGGPGICTQTPSAHPAVPNIRFVASCKKEFASITDFFDQYWKIVDSGDEGHYNGEVDKKMRKGYCCMKKKVKHESHAYYLSGMFLYDFTEAEVTCNEGLEWLWIVVCVLGAFSLSMCCVAINGALTPDQASSEEGSNPPFGETDDVVRQLMHKTSLNNGIALTHSPVPVVSTRNY